MASELRVLLVSGSFPEIRCGVGDYTARLARALVELGPAADGGRVEVHVLTSRAAESQAVSGVTVHPVMDRWSRAERSRVVRVLEAVRPDVVHVQFPSRMGVRDRSFLANALTGMLNRRGVPVVLTLHEFSERSVRFCLRAWWNARHAQALVYTNAFDRGAAQRWPGVRRRRGTVVPITANVLPEQASGRTRAELRASLAVPDGHLLAVHFGVLDADRGLGHLDELASELASELTVVVAGQLAPGADPALVRQRPGGARRIGPLPAPELSALLAAADIGLFPFEGGASGRRGSLLAAMAHGLAIVTTRGARLPERWQHGAELLLVPSGDVVALVAATRRLMVEADLRTRLAAAAATEATSVSWSQIARSMRDVYDRVVERAP